MDHMPECEGCGVTLHTNEIYVSMAEWRCLMCWDCMDSM